MKEKKICKAPKVKVSAARVKPKSRHEQKISKSLIVQTHQRKHLKQFDFFFYRSCFRIMNEFYKEQFKAFYNNQMKKSGTPSAQTTKEEIDNILRKFIVQKFGPVIFQLCPSFGEAEQMDIVNSMLMIVFSHRYCKDDVFIKDSIRSDGEYMDFSIIRDVMYKYSKKAQDRFFSYPIEAFFFSAFALSEDGIKYLESKPSIFGDEHKLERLMTDLLDLKNQAVESLRTISKSTVAKQRSNANLASLLLGLLSKLTNGKL